MSRKWAWIFASMITGIIFIWIIKIFIRSLSLLGLEAFWGLGGFTTMFVGIAVGFFWFWIGEKYLRVAEKFEYISEIELNKIEKEVFTIILIVTLAQIIL